MDNLEHGVLSSRDLAQAGVNRRQVQTLLAVGRLVRVRRGWFAQPWAHPVVVRAVTLGGTVSCTSALRLRGIWVPPDDRLHLRMSEHHRAQASGSTDVRICSVGERSAPSVAVDPLPTALRAALGCLDGEGAIVVLDSVLNKRLLTRAELGEVLSTSSGRVRRLLAETDEKSQSGTESMVRLRLRRRGITVRTQVQLDGVGRVDLLVGERLVIECDSREYHTSAANYETDRTRDRLAMAGGWSVLRLTYREVLYEWDEVMADILTTVRRRDHRAPRRARASR